MKEAHAARVVFDFGTLGDEALEGIRAGMIDQVKRHREDETLPIWKAILAAAEAEIERRRERPKSTRRKKLDLPLERLSLDGLKKIAAFVFHVELGLVEGGEAFWRESAFWELVGLEVGDLLKERERLTLH